jgi:hypothetical protein
VGARSRCRRRVDLGRRVIPGRLRCVALGGWGWAIVTFLHALTGAPGIATARRELGDVPTCYFGVSFITVPARLSIQ